MKNKGFTLIELLAVIVILAIIALIAVPIIMDLISKSKKGAFVDSAYAIVKAAELTMLEKIDSNHVNELEFTYSDGVETSSLLGTSLQYTGKKPTSGKVLIDKEGNVSLALHDGEFCVTKSFVNSVIESTDVSPDDCKLLPFQDSSLASIPEVSSGMIPITWDGTKWVKADISKEWFHYNQKKWANVVLVTESSRSNYQTGNPGMVIEEDDVLAYLVWIPRYRYQLFNVEAVAIEPIRIQIQFEDKDVAKSAGMVNGVHTNGEWYTHPAFTFGTGNDINGIWVGKFETSVDPTSLCYNEPTSLNCNHADDFPLVKPNAVSRLFKSNKNMFLTAQMFNDVSAYGNVDDAHMMKNIEWGAVVYLSHSLYGKNDKVDYSIDSPSDLHFTGGGIDNAYTINMNQSTTGNVYGVYDMSGGVYDRVMAATYTSDGLSISVSGTGFLEGELDDPSMDKYIDKYQFGTTHNNQDAYNRRILGDATGEVQGWYEENRTFPYNTGSWFNRGNRCTTDTGTCGLFNFVSTSGGSGNDSFRVVISK